MKYLGKQIKELSPALHAKSGFRVVSTGNDHPTLGEAKREIAGIVFPYRYLTRTGSNTQVKEKTTMIKAHFRLNAVKEFQGFAHGVEVELMPVQYGPDSEHRSFTDATPSGELRMFVTNLDVVEILKEHGTFEVTFVPLPSEQQ
jgi:hypothetical protein